MCISVVDVSNRDTFKMYWSVVDVHRLGYMYSQDSFIKSDGFSFCTLKNFLSLFLSLKHKDYVVFEPFGGFQYIDATNEVNLLRF